MKRVLSLLLAMPFASCGTTPAVDVEAPPPGGIAAAESVSPEASRDSAEEPTDRGGPARVRCIDYYDNGIKKLEGFTVDGIREGVWTFYTNGASKVWQGTYVDGQLDGPHTLFKGNEKYEEGSFRQGRRHGRWLRFDTGRRQVFSVTTYDRGLKHGPFVYYNAQQKISQQGQFEKGKMVGLSVSFHENGAKATEFRYVDGKIEGKYTSWYPTGEKETEVTYVAGKRQGPQITWATDGTQLAVTEYKNGRRVSAGGRSRR